MEIMKVNSRVGIDHELCKWCYRRVSDKLVRVVVFEDNNEAVFHSGLCTDSFGYGRDDISG